MKTLVLEAMPDLFWQEINENNWQSYFIENREEAEIVIIRTKTQFNRDLFEQLPNLKMIIRAGSGFDNIDLIEAENRKVIVCNTPEANAYSAYEQTLSFIFTLIKQLPECKDQILKGNWKRNIKPNWEISDLKALVVGVGRVGSQVAETLEYLGASVKGVDPYLTASDWKKKNLKQSLYKTGIQWCNLVTYHCPLRKETIAYFNNEVLNDLINPIWLINTSRGKVVDELAVARGLMNKKILGFASDVFTKEPWEVKEFGKKTNVILTPHVGAYTEKAKNRMSLETLWVWSDYVNNYKVTNNVDSHFTY